MNIAITIQNSYEDAKVELTNSINSDEIYISLGKGQVEIIALVNVEELKHAIRKISAR